METLNHHYRRVAPPTVGRSVGTGRHRCLQSVHVTFGLPLPHLSPPPFPLELRALNRHNPGSNPFVVASKLLKIRSFPVATDNSAVQMCTWLQIETDIGTNGLRTIIAAWLNAFQRSRNGVGMNKSVGGEVYKDLNSPKDWITILI